LAVKIIAAGLGEVRSNIIERKEGRPPERSPYMRLADARPTYGYKRIAAKVLLLIVMLANHAWADSGDPAVALLVEPGRASELCPQIWTQLQTSQTPQNWISFLSVMGLNAGSDTSPPPSCQNILQNSVSAAMTVLSNDAIVPKILLQITFLQSMPDAMKSSLYLTDEILTGKFFPNARPSQQLLISTLACRPLGKALANYQVPTPLVGLPGSRLRR
jgi:hypothetical protein